MKLHNPPSGGFRVCRAWGSADPCLKIFINQIILQIVFCQNYNTSKLNPVANDESFVNLTQERGSTGKRYIFKYFQKYYFTSLYEKHITENKCFWKTVNCWRRWHPNKKWKGSCNGTNLNIPKFEKFEPLPENIDHPLKGIVRYRKQPGVVAIVSEFTNRNLLIVKLHA